jgi:hypothetical protein
VYILTPGNSAFISSHSISSRRLIIGIWLEPPDSTIASSFASCPYLSL